MPNRLGKTNERFLKRKVERFSQGSKLYPHHPLRDRALAQVTKTKCAQYMRRGKPSHRTQLINNTPYSIIAQYKEALPILHRPLSQSQACSLPARLFCRNRSVTQ